MSMDGAPLSNAQARDVEALLHPYTNAVQHRKTGPHVIETGEGVYVYDEDPCRRLPPLEIRLHQNFPTKRRSQPGCHKWWSQIPFSDRRSIEFLRNASHRMV